MTETIEHILEVADRSSVRIVRFLYCDASSMIRGKTTAVPHLRQRVETGIGLVKGQLAMNMLDQFQHDTGLGATGEVRLVPDLSTFAVLPYAPNSAAMICDLIELDKEPWALCPRSVLKRQVQAAQDEGVVFQVAFEPEFMLASEDDSVLRPIDRSLCFSTEGMNRAAGFITAFIDALERQGLEVEQYYPELGHGQHEVSISHAPALAAADRHIFYRETLRGTALQHNLVASLAPKPFADQAGNGCHLHISAWDSSSGVNLLQAPDGLSDWGKSFVAGLLEHLPALVAVTCPSVNSYRRLQPRAWSSAYTCWGYENREAAVRVPSLYWGRERESTNLEIKCVDSSCNPYLALACVMAAGLDGVRRRAVPPDPVSVDPSTLSADEMQSLRVRRLPTSLKDALVELERSELLNATLGAGLSRTFRVVKYSEWAAFAAEDDQFEMANHRTKY